MSKVSLPLIVTVHANGLNSSIKDDQTGNSLVVQWLGLHTSTAETIGSILSLGTKIPPSCTVKSPVPNPPPPPQQKPKPTKVQQNRDVAVTAESERKLRSWDKSKEAERVGEEQTQQSQFQAKQHKAKDTGTDRLPVTAVSATSTHTSPLVSLHHGAEPRVSILPAFNSGFYQ